MKLFLIGVGHAPSQVALLQKLQRAQHERALCSSPMFSVEHWKHHAGPEWPELPDDDSYLAFENCKHPDCILALLAVERGTAAEKDETDTARPKRRSRNQTGTPIASAQGD